MNFIDKRTRTRLHMKGWAVGLALKKKDNFFNPSQLLFTVRKLAYPTFTHDGNVFIRVKSLFMSQDSNISACLFVSCGKTHQTLSLSVLIETSFFFYHLQHYDEPDEFKDILMYLNIAFTVLYMIEAGLKFFALRLVSFVHSVVMASMASSCVAFEKAPLPFLVPQGFVGGVAQASSFSCQFCNNVQLDVKHGAFIFINLLFQTYSAINILTKTSNLITFFFQNYFRDYWNVFDFIVVLGGLLDVIVTVISQSVSKGRRGTDRPPSVRVVCLLFELIET